MALFDKASLLGCTALKTETVTLGDGEIIVSELGAADYISIWTNEKYQTDGVPDMAKFTPALIACCVVDAEGNRIFSDDDIPALSRMAHEPFFKIADVARRLNGMTGDEIKNSEQTE